MYDVPLEHGNCPNCGVSLDGGGIWEHFFREAKKIKRKEKIPIDNTT